MTNATNDFTRSVAGKQPYSAPVLTVYGSVRDLTRTGQGSGADGGGTMTMRSDPEVKENVIRVGEHPIGVGLYLFSYKAGLRDTLGHGRKFGVMADEVELVMPEAIVVDEDGYRSVDYAKLGITFH